ncbi:unnamed protein product [Rhizoctonia solani]|uniref:Uncharacterized protein n=1 Tax=Rhizoctonia solani TaxID=456999 RepID=A0A8H3AWB1_9AGAM|nr:unnamed protein product [Rhizoctonia solani]
MMKTTANITYELEQLCCLLLWLPPKDLPPGFKYPFEGFFVDKEYIKITGSIQGSVNHSLEVAFRSRAHSPICFKSNGADLLAVVDVLTNHITGIHDENTILLKWIKDLQAAANHAFNNPHPLPEKREQKPTEKRDYIEVESELKASTKKQRTEAKAKAAEAQAWTEIALVLQLDPKINMKSGSNMAHSLIPGEASHVCALSVKHLKQQSHLTLTCDGATTRRVQSIYTIHVTNPKTQQPHLLAGHEDSGKLHTGEHILGLMLKIIEEIGPNCFSAVTTDNADALLPNLPGIVKLIEDGVIKIGDNDKLAWLKEPDKVRSFEDGLQLIRALLRPFARSVTCLKSTAATPGDVCSFWLACLASLNDLFIDPVRCRRLKLTQGLISDIYGIVNGRFEELFDGHGRNIYFAALFLNFCYMGSKVFRRRNANPLAAKIRLPACTQASASADSACDPLNSHDTPDSDLRDTIPSYEPIGNFIGTVLIHEVNSGRAPEIFDHFEDVWAIFTEYRYQTMCYVRQVAPFDRYIHVATPQEYWTKLSRHADAAVLAYVALKLLSIVPNSMAEERTVLNFTKLNRPDRAKQKVATIVYMTQIRQHELRELNKDNPPPTAPTVRFRDLSDHVKASVGSVPTVVSQSTETDDDTSESMAEDVADTWEAEAGFDEVIERPPAGSRTRFELPGSEEIDLTDPMLLDLLSDHPIPGVPHQEAQPILPFARLGRSEVQTPLAAESFTF